MNKKYVEVVHNGRRCYEHRAVMEEVLGRRLTSAERVHHVNGDRRDNRRENLQLVSSQGRHMAECHPGLRGPGKPKPSQEIMAILANRGTAPSGAYAECFCGLPANSRNLCANHYGVAYRYKLLGHVATIFSPAQDEPTRLAILNRLAFPRRTYRECFCGKAVTARNLCNTHYAWAQANRLFEAKAGKYSAH